MNIVADYQPCPHCGVPVKIEHPPIPFPQRCPYCGKSITLTGMLIEKIIEKRKK